MRLQRDSYAPKSCAFDAANVQFLRAHLCKSHPVLQQVSLFFKFGKPIAHLVFGEIEFAGHFISFAVGTFFR